LTGKAIRNALYLLIAALWIWLSIDLNRSLLNFVPHHETGDQVVYYLVIPAIVIVGLLTILLRRWRREHSAWDGVTIGSGLLLIPLYLLPMQ